MEHVIRTVRHEEFVEDRDRMVAVVGRQRGPDAMTRA
jgi:hypothetical protein